MLYIKKIIVWYFTILSGEILNQIYNEINYEVKYHTMIVIFNGTINMIANTFDIILDLNWNILSSIDLNSISNRTLGYIGYLADKLYTVSSQIKHRMKQHERTSVSWNLEMNIEYIECFQYISVILCMIFVFFNKYRALQKLKLK